MKKINQLSIFLFLAFLGISPQAFSYPLPTLSVPEVGEEMCSYMSEVTKTKSEIDSTVNLVKKGVLEGVPGYLSAILSRDWSGLTKGMISQGYDLYKKDAEMKLRAKEAAQEEANEIANEKYTAMQEGTEAAIEAVDENREIAAENRKEKTKKVYNWIKTNRGGVTQILDGVTGGNSASSIFNNTLDDVDQFSK